jgi:hypothetical protein
MKERDAPESNNTTTDVSLTRNIPMQHQELLVLLVVGTELAPRVGAGVVIAD